VGEVSCESLRAEVQAGKWPAGPDVEAHIASCPTCADELLQSDPQTSMADLARLARQPVASPESLVALEAAVERRRERERGPLAWLRERPLGVQRGLAASVSFAVVLVVWTLTSRVDWSVYPAGRLAAEILALGVLVVVVTRAALRPLTLPARPLLAVAALVAGVVGILAVTGLPPAHAAHPASLEGLGAALIPRAMACLVFGSICALPVFGLLLASDRLAGAVRGTVRLSAVGAAIVGVLVLQVHCPIVHVAHLRVGHATVLVVMLLAGLAYSAFSSRYARSAP